MKEMDLRDRIALFIRNPFIRHKKRSPEEFWALKHVSFDVYNGDFLGIIGSNGAGKSTLLKIISRITPPTEGEIILRGKVTSLLEIGTGFNPELTGRENVFLNGTIMGMRHSEIQKKFHEIIRFADIGKFIDIPINYYSSGMTTRLAFSVASHLDPDILMLDEVMSVGDAQFSKKSMSKMQELHKKGKAVIFVSHNMEIIRSLCNKVLYLKKGAVVMFGETDSVISNYLTSVTS
jgi:lipopolysaccharide transport system ATP-binding protein